MTAAFASSFRFLIYNQLIGTVVNSVQQSIILQLVSTQVLGLVNVQLALIPNIILTLSREPFRKTTPRFPGKEHASRLAYTSLLLLPLGLFITLVQFLVSLFTNPSWKLLPNFGTSFAVYSLSALLELAFEPYYTQVSSNYALRKDVDTRALLMRSAFSLGVAYLYGRNPNQAILAFSFVQFFNSAYYFQRYRRAAPIKNIIGGWHEVRHIRRVYWTFFWDTLARFFLAQGDVILLSSFASPVTQGLYSLLTNYASLVLRLVFTPLEESIRSFYSANVAEGDIFSAVFVFSQWCSLMLSVFGSQYASRILSLVVPASSKIYELLPLIPAYCHLMSLMILNGILEAYLHAVLDVSRLSKLKTHTLVITGVYFALAFYLLQASPQMGIIYANVFNFGMRILLALSYLKFQVSIVDPFSLVLAAGCGMLCYFLNLPLQHGLTLGILTASTVLVRERGRFIVLKSALTSK